MMSDQATYNLILFGDIVDVRFVVRASYIGKVLPIDLKQHNFKGHWSIKIVAKLPHYIWWWSF